MKSNTGARFKFTFLWLLLTPLGAGAVTVEGVPFPSEIQVQKETLRLNGAGVRTATIFKARVYAAGLYLKERAQNEKTVLDAPYPKVIEMTFFRAIDGKDIRAAWDDSFRENCEVDCDADRASLEKLKTLMTDVKEGDRMTYTFLDGKVLVDVNGAKRGEVLSKHFPRNLLATWVGKNPPTEALKQGLLGEGEAKP